MPGPILGAGDERANVVFAMEDVREGKKELKKLMKEVKKHQTSCWVQTRKHRPLN